eukprot:TRINITY_DN6612_c0_g1_i1.p1 TRINITY_DN6612_c0_g1~~TRINITY_DN6612_c0_g1_i1.p1  ORF type:complete len:507 (+),score=103.46 TRINITY_DN6612_c0_g1_i1:47-1567(+)
MPSLPAEFKQAIQQDDVATFASLLNQRRLKKAPECGNSFFNGEAWSVQILPTNIHSVLTEKFDADYTYMHYACEAGSVKCVRYLCQLGSPTSSLSESGTTPIHLAVDSNRIECIREVSRYGADLDTPDGWLGNTPIHWATHRKNFRMLQTLLDSGASPNIPNNEGNMAVHMAARTGDYSCIEVLLQAGADINTVNGAKQTPLQIAEKYRFDQCILLLRSPPPIRVIARDPEYVLPDPGSLAESRVGGQDLSSTTEAIQAGSSSPMDSPRERAESVAPKGKSEFRKLTIVTPPEGEAQKPTVQTPKSPSNPGAPSSARSDVSFKSSLPNPGSKTQMLYDAFVLKLNTWQDMVSFIMTPIAKGQECVCTIEREPGLTDIYSLLLKHSNSAPQSLLLLSFKRKKSASPNYPIGLTKRDVTERNTPGYLGKIRGNTLHEEYIAYNSGLNPDRKATIGRLAVRSELAILRVVGRNPRRLELSLPNPENVGPDMFAYESKTPEWDEGLTRRR